MKKDRTNECYWEGVDLVKLQFTDLFGHLKMVDMTKNQLEQLEERGYAVNRFALEGLRNRNGFRATTTEEIKKESRELFLKPDLGTCQLLPWESGQENVARIFCDLYDEDGNPSWADTRSIFKRILKKADELGLKIQFDFQCEFYLFHTDDEGRPTTVTHEVAGYYDAGSIDLAENVRRDMILSLSEAGMEIESAHHGMTPGQHRFLLKAQKGLDAADYLLTFKAAVRKIAKRHGLHASFMPKPSTNGDGSGLHIGISLRDKNGLDITEQLKSFHAGILYHLRELMIFTNPLVNSYKRLAAERTSVFQPEFPAAIWETGNDKVVRLEKANKESGRIEVLYPDVSSNPYLALSALVAAGIDGIEKRAQMDEQIKRVSFPETLGTVIFEFEKSQFAKEVLGERLCSQYLEGKKEEWERFCAFVTDWELKEYLYRC